MEKKENYKDIEIKGRKFRIQKFDARTGSYMVVKLMGIIGPMVKNIDVKAVMKAKKVEDVDVNLTEAFSGISGLSEEDFSYVQDRCLGVCYEMLPAGLAAVLMPDGSYGVTGIDTDVTTVMALTVHALIFNVSGFFDASLLTSMSKGLAGTFRQNTKT
jgi:hypothetical protein